MVQSYSKEEHDKCKAVGKPSGNCMDSAAWTLIFLVPAKYVAKDTFKGVSSLPIQDITGEYIDTDNEYMYYYSAEFVK